MPNIRQAREALGVRLRELRQSSGLNGREFARRAGWLATKVSKIEHGKQTPSEADLRIWAGVCGADDEVVSLCAQLRNLELAYATWRRQLRAGTAARQRRLSEIEAKVGLVRWFEPSTVPGLLQTAQYARAIFAQVIAVHGLPDDLEAGVTARMDRQRVLRQPGQRFHFLVTEAALRNLVCPPEVLKSQVEGLIASAGMPSVALGVIPFGARLAKSPVHGFVIRDEALVSVETFAAELSLTQPEEIRLYGRIFDLMRESAVYGKAARKVLLRVIDDLSALVTGNEEQSP
ncbi:helix-turn-helix domain-containing protein [Sinosporangium siamense]|uniref:Transcriptional regulator n=1 Tax=Sinosporangium siamense TaxID=1367973 RepID=A0A919V2N6_9ACTN|nr:helix-turn-helix transcriptional regulator [Sinosporangium siamense]GII90120.1 transcriptional regulator [Sinosporangium siamense]